MKTYRLVLEKEVYDQLKEAYSTISSKKLDYELLEKIENDQYPDSYHVKLMCENDQEYFQLVTTAKQIRLEKNKTTEK